MEIKCLSLGYNQTNCYLVWEAGSKTCAVIDPGDRGDFILQQVDALGLSVDAVFLTHGHFDHVGGLETILEKTDSDFWIGEGDYTMETGWLFPLERSNLPTPQFFRHGQTLQAGGLTFKVFTTPGHSKGSVCLLCEDVLFAGDTLFSGSIGRTDFPGSDWNEMERSLRFLTEMPEDVTVYAGHGGKTTIGHEKQTNPFLR